MKKLFSVFFAIVAIVAIAACSSGADAKAVAEKIDKGETLTQADYTVATDYCMTMINDMKPLLEKAIEAQKAGDTSKAEELEAEGKKLEEKYPYAEKFMQSIMTASKDDMGEDNYNKFQEMFQEIIKLAM